MMKFPLGVTMFSTRCCYLFQNHGVAVGTRNERDPSAPANHIFPDAPYLRTQSDAIVSPRNWKRVRRPYFSYLQGITAAFQRHALF